VKTIRNRVFEPGVALSLGNRLNPGHHWAHVGRAVMYAPELATCTHNLRGGLRPPAGPEAEYGSLIHVSTQFRRCLRNCEFAPKRDPADTPLLRLPAVAQKMVPSPRVFDRKTLPGIKWIREEHYRLRHHATISRRGGAFQVGHGVLQCGGRKAVHCRVDQPFTAVQDRAEEE
jgi:hypothetical protein